MAGQRNLTTMGALHPLNAPSGLGKKKMQGRKRERGKQLSLKRKKEEGQVCEKLIIPKNRGNRQPDVPGKQKSRDSLDGPTR